MCVCDGVCVYMKVSACVFERECVCVTVRGCMRGSVCV